MLPANPKNFDDLHARFAWNLPVHGVMSLDAVALPAAQDAAIASSLGLTRAELVAGWQRWLEVQAR